MQALEKRQAYQSLDNEVQRLTAEKGSLFEQKEQKEQAAAQYQQQLAEQRQAWQDKLAEAQSLARQYSYINTYTPGHDSRTADNYLYQNRRFNGTFALDQELKKACIINRAE